MIYIYRYIHPDYPWLYVGRTGDLQKRIHAHDSQEKDNIDRKYERLLKEAVVYYIEVDNETQAHYVEAFLIDKYSPLLNKQGVRKDGSLCNVNMTLPRWKKYIREYDLNEFHYSPRSVVQKLKQDVFDTEKNMQELEQKLITLRKKIAKSYEELAKKQATQKDLQIITSNILMPENVSYTLKEIRDIYEAYSDCDMVFELYACNPSGDYVTYKITCEGLYIDNQLRCKWSDIFFEIKASCGITKVNNYTSSAVGLYILRDYYTERINALEAIKKTAKFKDVLNQKMYGKWESEDLTLYAFIENDKIDRITIGRTEDFIGETLTNSDIQNIIAKHGENDVDFFETPQLFNCTQAKENYYDYKKKLKKTLTRMEELKDITQYSTKVNL